MRISDELSQCVVYIVVPKNINDFHPVGTAFFVSYPLGTPGREAINYLVTARHVAESVSGKDYYVRINDRTGKARYVHGEAGHQWIFHPTDPLVDVAIIVWAPDSKVFDYKRISTQMFFSEEDMYINKVGPGDDVFMIGLFSKMLGIEKNIPIVRTGTIAMMPLVRIPTKGGPREVYLIEARSIGGISGSPVFVLKPSNLVQDGYLLGLMHGHWDIPADMMFDSTGEDRSTERVNMGIAMVIPAKIILEVLEQAVFINHRQAAVASLKARLD